MATDSSDMPLPGATGKKKSKVRRKKRDLTAEPGLTTQKTSPVLFYRLLQPLSASKISAIMFETNFSESVPPKRGDLPQDLEKDVAHNDGEIKGSQSRV
jgi:hypothetical protein